MCALKKYLILTPIIIFLFFTNCAQKEKKGDMLILPPEEVVNISAAQKTKAIITGERKNVSIGKEKNDVWTILYKDNEGNIHSTIIKKLENTKNKIGDSLIIYYDNSNPISLPIYEKQYKILKR